MFGREKSLWQEPSRKLWMYYCPHCAVQRRLSFSTKPQPRHYAQVALTALMFMLATWSWFTWKGMVAFLPFWIVFEAIYRTKARAALICTNCGFDPFLYVRNRDEAKKEIRNHYEVRLARKKSAQPKSVPITAPARPPASAPENSTDA